MMASIIRIQFPPESYILETTYVVNWSEFLATDPEVWVRFPALPDFLRWLWNGGPFSLVSTTEELLGRKSSGSGLESREEKCYGWQP
jgi:hypothetical protein